MKNDWVRLDNAAKIFPAAVSDADNQVFRFSCDLIEPVDAQCLQRALLETIRSFPVFQVTMKRGLFWYYLERTDLQPQVREEYKPPCAPLYDRDRKTLLYEVTYYHTRINLEVFHALTDGTGALQFLCALVSKYLSLYYGFPEPLLDYDASLSQKSDDSFLRHYDASQKAPKEKDLHACRLTGRKLAEHRLSLIQGHLPVREVLRVAHEHKVSLTSLLAGYLMASINEELTARARRRPVVVNIPVNLRNYFDSASARNFFSIVYTSYDFHRYPDDVDAVVGKVQEDLKKTLNLDHLTARLNGLFSIERNVFARIAPLWFKDIVLGIAYQLGENYCTAAFSNLGVVKLPPDLSPYIRSFDVCTGTNRLQACTCTFGDTLSISFTSPFVSTDIQKRFFRKLTAQGIPLEIAACGGEEEQEAGHEVL